MRRLAAHGVAFLLRGIAAAHRGADGQWLMALFYQRFIDACQRRLQVDLDVVGQRLEGRDIDHLGLVGQVAAGQALFEQFVEDCQERSERFA
ncbi:hypothetical protein D3C72_1454370 [compost metagenome]